MLDMFFVRRRARFFWRNAAPIVLAIVVFGCAGVGAEGNRYPGDVFRSGDSFVRLVPTETGAAANLHPFAVSAAELRRLLSGIRVSGASSIRNEPVFTKEELDTIVPPLAVALSRAGPHQDVTFAATGYHGVFGSHSPKSATTGRLFVNADGVNLIFGLMQERLGVSDHDEKITVMTPGLRARRIEWGPWKIVPDAARFYEKRVDWLVFNRSAITPAAATTPPSGGASAKPGEETVTPKIDAEAQEIEKKLRVLDRLKEKGVITDQEYRERRRAILQGI